MARKNTIEPGKHSSPDFNVVLIALLRWNLQREFEQTVSHPNPHRIEFSFGQWPNFVAI